jgi:undecaprenyl-diphosphatase
MALVVVVLGLVEGLTEFLPVSSTGHLILVGHWLGYTGEHASIFEVVIQVGAILAVVWEYRSQLGRYLVSPAQPTSRRFILNLILAFLPAASLGFVFHDSIKARLFGPVPVAVALIVGAIVIVIVERLPLRPSVRALDGMHARAALAIGVAQCAALFPGFSRAAATILGGLVVGLDRPTAAQFSFLLAIPTLLGAAVLDLAKGLGGLTSGELAWMGVGMVVSFLSAWAAVRWFVRYVSHHSLLVFAAYRIVLGILVLLFAART